MQQVLHLILVVICGSFFLANCNVVRNEDICGPHNGRRLYLELGEQGILYAKNVSLIKNQPRQNQASRVYVTNSSHDQCSLELVTCPSCVITITFKTLALSHHCNDGGMMMDSPCRCDYVWISEPPYEDVSGTPYCGVYSPITYRSSTRTLSIALLYSQSHRHAFTLEYTAERNRLHLKGVDSLATGTNGINSTGGGILTSPFFPTRYPRDLGMEYIITCPTEAPSCRVRVLFSDFQLATVSIIEFYDWNGQRLDVSSGARFRPPVIVSSGPSLLIRFYANGGTGLGYKAFYSFVYGHMFDKAVQPITDCGGYVENLGGAITMMNMVEQGVNIYDCVWLIRPPKNFIHMKTHMYLKVVTFADMAGNTELTTRQGPTSALMPLEVLRHPASQLQPPRMREHVAPVTSGFHVSLRGTFGPTSRLAIAYATFSYMDCFTGSDFLCQNHRCIPSQLNCDGFDHCGDNSDEPATCFRDWEVEPQDRKWHMNKPNYYFPKIDRYPDLKTATLVFVASSLGLIVLISALIILLYRMGARARQQRELQSRLQTISELLVFDIADGARIDEITVSDDPPVYEAPPGYDEVVKVGMDGIEVTRRKKKGNLCREPRSRSSPNQRSQEASPSTGPLLEGTSRSCQTTPIPTSVVSQVPESPPPRYVTPPGTIPRNLDVSSLSMLPDCMDLQRGVSGRGSRARNSWLRSSGEYSRSLSSALEGSAAAVAAAAAGSCVGPSTSADAEALGAYLQNYGSSRAGPLAAVLLAAGVNGEPSQAPPSSETPTSASALTNASQPCDYRDASSPTRRGYVGDATEYRISDITHVDERSEVVEEQHEAVGEPPPLPRPAEGAVVAVEDATQSRGSEEHQGVENSIAEGATEPEGPSCTCEGACGCANNDKDPIYGDSERVCNRSIRRPRPCRHHRIDHHQQPSAGNQSHDSVIEIEPEIHQESRELPGTRINGDAETSCTKNAIIRLLGSSRTNSRSSQNCSLNSTTVSTASSTPSGTYGRAFAKEISNLRKVSICSRDSRVTKTSMISSSHSIEKLHDEFEIVSESASILGTTNPSSPNCTPARICTNSSSHRRSSSSSRRRRRCRRPSLHYSSCDLESLYESIQALDNFLARRGKSINHGKNQTVAARLADSSTPKPSTTSNHTSSLQEPNETTFFINGNKNWRSSDEAFSN